METASAAVGATTMKTAAPTAVEATTATTRETTAASPAVTAATALSECWIWRENETEEDNKSDQG